MQGAFILSIDVELAWGFVGRVKLRREDLEPVKKVREILDPFLKIIGDHRIPTTWAIVGHVFLERCESGLRPHPDMPRPSYDWFEGDWYKYDPCSDVVNDPFWYGKDVVEKILTFCRNSPVEQDICCHSFSHQIFGDPGCSEDLAMAEINKCLEIMKKYDIYPKIFVFPIGSVGHLDTLKEKEFIAFRGGVPELVQRYRSLERSAWNRFRKHISLGIEFLSYYSLRSAPAVMPKQVLPGLWNIPGSMCFSKKRKVPTRLVVLRAKKSIDRAIREKKCFHMYTHLHNFGVNTTSLLQGFDDILSFVDKKRKNGQLEVFNMKQFAEMAQK